MKTTSAIPLFVSIILAAGAISCSDDSSSPNTPAEPDPLHSDAAFPVGVAVPVADWEGGSIRSGDEPRAVVERHFNAVAAANIMKPEYLQPSPGNYFWTDSDWLVDFAEQYAMKVHGHTLVWHNQTPGWMYGLPNKADSVLRAHISSVVGRYKGQIASWDVVNEAFEDDGSVRQTFWQTNVPDYIAQSFIAAHGADPDADLYCNDYNLAVYPDKLDAVIAMVNTLIARDVPIHGIGFQMHVLDSYPDSGMIAAALGKAVSTGLKIRLSELEVSVNFFKQYSSLSDELAEKQRARYREIVSIYKNVVPEAQQGGITVWGITDAHTWFLDERPEWPLLFDENYRPKPAFYGFAEGLKE